MLMSALGVGIGVGVGLGLASGSQAVSKWAGSDAITPYTMEMEMLSLLSNGRDSNVTFDQFPYYLRFQFSLSSLSLSSMPIFKNCTCCGSETYSFHLNCQ